MRELLGAVLLMCIPALVYAQDPIILSRKAEAILLDGTITEEGWHSARPLPPFTMYEPTFRNDPTKPQRCSSDTTCTSSLTCGLLARAHTPQTATERSEADPFLELFQAHDREVIALLRHLPSSYP